MNNAYEKIKEEQKSDIILIQKLQKEQDETMSFVRKEELEKKMVEIQGRIDGLNIALKILTN